MKRTVGRILLTACLLLSACAPKSDSSVARIALDETLARQIVESGYIHSPLPVDRSRSNESFGLKKEVLSEIRLADSVKLVYPTTTGIRAKGSPDDPDYATYGGVRAKIDLGGNDFSKYNRVCFKALPDCPGQNVVNVNFHIPGNAGHLVNLIDGQWNECFLDIQDIDRSHLDHISFNATIRGSDCGIDTISCITIRDIRFQYVKNPKKLSGWDPDKGTVILASSGYMASSPKIALADTGTLKGGDTFRLVVSESGKTAFKGKVQIKTSSIGTFALMDFSSFRREGKYQLEAGNVRTGDFRISDALWIDSQWRALNYIFCQRCGYEVPGIHMKCHEDLMSVHGSQRISYGGGWHDAGDLSQQTLQTADVSYSLLEAARATETVNPALSARLQEEALWGMNFCLRNRYGDGYRASSVGLLIWQDGKIGSFDDITTVRVQNLAFDNFLYSGYEAYAAMAVENETDRERFAKAAKEDFDFAKQKFSQDGFDRFIYLYEHSYNTSHSQYMATVSWAASMLYKLTGDEVYAAKAVEAVEYALDCQQKEPLENGMKGFFYRDKDKRSIVHYIHQSREQFYMMALEALMMTQPQSKDFPRWKESMTLYGEYLKSLMQYTYPYGMVPSGLYMEKEYEDTEGFEALHLFAPEDAPARYDEQLRKGVQVDTSYYVKRFPV